MPAALEEPRIWRELDLVKVILRSNLKREDIETLRKTVELAEYYFRVHTIGARLGGARYLCLAGQMCRWRRALMEGD